MNNLAGITQDRADNYVRYELERARIPVHAFEPGAASEVQAKLYGVLPGFTFRRAWRYWVVEGLVPIAVAERLYADPVGATDVRADGDSGCRPPSTWMKWITPNGKLVVPANQEAECKAMAERHETMKHAFDSDVFSDDPASLGAQAFVKLYHIDSEVGLRLFVDTITGKVAQ